jgi:hypothetical protein
MIFSEELAYYQSQNNVLGLSNVRAFLQQWNIDQIALETFVRRSARSGQLYYVSTVPRGLGGSTSDVDFMVIVDDAVERNSNLTSMLFNQGRRVGIKTLTRAEVLAGLAAVEARLAAWDAGDYRCDPLPMKWINLERAINGVTFEGEPEFIGHLAILARWAGAMAFADFCQNCLLTELAIAAEEAGAARAYGEAAVMAAMDCLMAACGRVQWNTKWIYERWRIFLGELGEKSAALRVHAVERLLEALQAPHVSAQHVREALGDVRRCLLGHDSSRRASDRTRLVQAPDVSIDDFLPRAVVLQGPTGAAVVDKAVLERVLGDVPPPDPNAASVGLALSQKGLLCVEFQRSRGV